MGIAGSSGLWLTGLGTAVAAASRQNSQENRCSGVEVWASTLVGRSADVPLSGLHTASRSKTIAIGCVCMWPGMCGKQHVQHLHNVCVELQLHWNSLTAARKHLGSV